MTGYTVHTGASEKFVRGWDRIFAEKKKAADGSGKGSKQKKASAKAASKKRSGGK